MDPGSGSGMTSGILSGSAEQRIGVREQLLILAEETELKKLPAYTPIPAETLKDACP
jgi:hypothetical protein